ncbi:uncharacterized protein VTP21DRAFT_8951 [Calcarisporiella thermophila]|uniref:uncharacterized protein n=1 Tax=Calcarisporiella thermophila TaxID=911321 RepID=UPI00374491A7
MATHREAVIVDTKFVDPAPMPDGVPKVSEVGATSAPLKSAAFFIGQYCKDYNEDFMLCKNENADPAHCLKEGRKVTRCAMDLLRKLRENCDKEFEQHWQCLDKNNQEYTFCRKEENKFNSCVFKSLGLEKVIPGATTQVHLNEKPLHAKR